MERSIDLKKGEFPTYCQLLEELKKWKSETNEELLYLTLENIGYMQIARSYDVIFGAMKMDPSVDFNFLHIDDAIVQLEKMITGYQFRTGKQDKKHNGKIKFTFTFADPYTNQWYDTKKAIRG